jgi:4-diphosphocytidyl-2-C-methyl-D-erythritol kinase
MRLRVPCPAKVNLFLSVGPPDRRGYHPIRTIFQAIDLCDTLEVEVADSDEVVCSSEEVPENNTVSKTLRLLKEVVNLPPLRVTIYKRIPSQAGLGGGSSDAAGLIRAAKAIAQVPVPEAELHGLAQTVGMDVPFFLIGGKALGEGYGERLRPLPDSPEEWFVVAKPPVGCDTAAAYRLLDEKPRDWKDLPTDDTLYNDFERVAPCESLDLIERLQVLGARDAALSGSGSAVFGRFNDRHTAERASKQIESETWVCRSLGRQESLTIT